MDIALAFKLLLKNKWYLIIVPLISLLISFLLTFDMKPEYKSTAKLATRFTTEDRINVTNEKSNLRDADVKFNNLVETMNSELIVSMLSYRLILNDLTGAHPFRKPDAEFAHYLDPDEKKKVIKIFQIKLNRFELLSNYDYAEKKLLDLLTSYGYVNWVLGRDLKVDRVEGSDFVSVTYTSENPFLSALIVNTLCEEAIRYDNFLGAKRADQSVRFFENLLDEKKNLLEEKSSRLADYKKSSRTYGVAGSSQETGSGIAAQEAKRSELQSRIQLLRLSIASLSRRLQSSASPQHQNDVSENILRLRKRIDDLNASPKDAATQKTVNDLSSLLQVELNKLSETRTPGKSRSELEIEKEQKEIELNVAETDLSSVESMIYTLRQNASGESVLDAQQRQVNKATDEYLSTLDRYNTERSKAMISSPLQLAIQGQPNSHPEFPKRYLVIGLASVASFFLSGFMILFLEFVSPKPRSPELLRLKTGLPLLGATTRIALKNLKLNDLFLKKNNDQIERFKRCLQKVRYEIEKSNSQVLLVTSTSVGQGKSFLILYLSAILAVLKKKVLIIDTNFPHNSLSQILKKKTGNGKEPNEPNHSHDMMVIDYPNTFIYSIPISANFSIYAVGNSGCASTPSEIFSGRDFGRTIDMLKRHYDYIIMEGASLNGYSDSRELMDYADKAIAVFSATSAIKPTDLESIEYLKNLNGKFLGTVLNQVDDSEIDVGK
ncbi:MAG TPA: Wzz/FepE/Etk N-terminal domain-containing protein [Cyclobacteriaceae bacterium]|jgi:Mrp family chromosome partitioning ATPase|nr:Wzz/FepE/Etk N-terminal domain-containing protein [Cyclobacteriaceae bacterium]